MTVKNDLFSSIKQIKIESSKLPVRRTKSEQGGNSPLGLMRLRQICDTPALWEDHQGDRWKQGSLRDLLGQIKDGEHRVFDFLLNSQHVRYFGEGN